MLGRALRSAGRAAPGACAVAAAIAVVASSPAAGASEPGLTGIAAALRHASVYANPTASSTLSPGEARRVDKEIARRDPGRIRIAIVSDAQAARAGGLTALANALDRKLGVPGTVIATAGSHTWLVTSYSDTEAAKGAVQQAFDSRKRFVDQVVESVDGIAAVDPGPAQSRHPSPPSSPGTPPAGSQGPDVSWGILALVIGAPVLFFLALGGTRRWRAARQARETFDDDLADARQELVALGDDISELDLSDSMPNADPAGKRDYEDAMTQYQRAERLLGEKANPRRLARANAALAEGKRLMQSARARFAVSTNESAKPGGRP